MILRIRSEFEFLSEETMDFLLQFEVSKTDGQALEYAKTSLTPNLEHTRVSGQDAIGERIWLNAKGSITARHEAKVLVNREAADLMRLVCAASAELPAEAVAYLFDTRYCLTEKFAPFAQSEFGSFSGGALVLAIRDWIAQHFTYDPTASTAETTSVDSFLARRGVCRDYAHVLISLVRASGIPARYVACYAPDVAPPDFHAVAQVYLSDPATGHGSWHLVDPTAMSEPGNTAIIGVGRDAADVSFLTSFGMCQFVRSTVDVQRHE
ncbi:transglutaminase family protein [Altererythrobacter sp. GH1-8]|uniref:transglutaminase-like domain-containing protein n=1 Tax=Altererythrobacter sp. GH1-8 TaxID=3349333 RepID=UPI00374DED0D